ncbi:DUF3089 domain-containing protein [Sphingomonas sp. MMS24-JH45]
MARKFLYVFAGLIALAIAGALAYRIWGVEPMRMAMVPGQRFRPAQALAVDAYRDRRMWLARPDIPGNPASWTPRSHRPAPRPAGRRCSLSTPPPTLNLIWTAPLDDAEANARAALFLRGQASAFNEVGEIWALRYRQATFGAFLTTQTDAEAALDFAYRDVAVAFDAFLAAIPARSPDHPGRAQPGAPPPHRHSRRRHPVAHHLALAAAHRRGGCRRRPISPHRRRCWALLRRWQRARRHPAPGKPRAWWICSRPDG